MYSSTLSLTSALDGGPRSARFTLKKLTGYPLYKGWVSPRAGLDGREKFRPHRDLIPGPSSP